MQVALVCLKQLMLYVGARRGVVDTCKEPGMEYSFVLRYL